MSESIIIAVVTVSGTALSAFFGVIVASKMTDFRLCKLEKKVELHNEAVVRIAVLERTCLETEHRVSRLEDGRG